MADNEMIIIPALKSGKRRSWFECTRCHEVYWKDDLEIVIKPPCEHNATQALISEPIAILKLKKRFKFVVEEKK